MLIQNAKDLEDLGLFDPDNLHPQGARAAVNTQLGFLEKYVADGLAIWRNWAGVYAIEDAKGEVDGLAIHRQSKFDPQIWISGSEQLGSGKHYQRRAIASMDRGHSPPSQRPQMHTVIHEASHAIADLLVECEIPRTELSARVSKLFGYEWTPDDQSRKSIELLRSAVSKYGGDQVAEYLTDALVEWNEFGEKAGRFAIAVGTTADRYFARNAAGAALAGEIIACRTAYLRAADLVGAPAGERDAQARLQLTASERQHIPLGFDEESYAEILLNDDVPDWQATYNEFESALKNEAPLPKAAWSPLNLSGAVNANVFVPHLYRSALDVQVGANKSGLAEHLQEVEVRSLSPWVKSMVTYSDRMKTPWLTRLNYSTPHWFRMLKRESKFGLAVWTEKAMDKRFAPDAIPLISIEPGRFRRSKDVPERLDVSERVAELKAQAAASAPPLDAGLGPDSALKLEP